MTFGTSAELASYIATSVSALVAAYYSYLTRQLVLQNQQQIRGNEEQLRSQQRPHVDVSLIVPEGIPEVQLRITNTGLNAASDLKLTVSPDFYMFGNKSDIALLQNAFLFSNVIKRFAPRTVFVFGLDSAYGPAGNQSGVGNPSLLKVSAVYSWLGTTYMEETLLDMNTFNGSTVQSSASLEELRKLNGNLERLERAIKALPHS